jgi:hypothetical protein
MGRKRTRPINTETVRAFDGLKNWPADALDWLHAQFGQKRVGAGLTYAEILGELKRTWNLDWNDSSLSNYYGYWRSVLYVEDKANAEATAILAGLVGGHPTEELKIAAKQIIQQQRLLALTRLGDSDPTAVVALSQRDDRLELDRDKFDLSREKKLLQDEKLKLDQERLQIERDKAAAIDRPSLFLEFWKMVVETIAGGSPEGAAVLNQHFDQVMARIKAGV